MKKQLVTGGPVHAHLDAVKVTTNRFKGGLMCQLSEALAGRAGKRAGEASWPTSADASRHGTYQGNLPSRPMEHHGGF